MDEVVEKMELSKNYGRKEPENDAKKSKMATKSNKHESEKEKLTSENFLKVMREMKQSCHHEEDAIFLSLLCEKFSLYKNYRDQKEKEMMSFSTMAILKECIKMVEDHFGIGPMSNVTEKWKSILVLDDPIAAKLVEFIDENNIKNFPRLMEKVTKSLETYMRNYILYKNIKLPRNSEQLPNVFKKAELASLLRMLIMVVKLDDKDETHFKNVFSSSGNTENDMKTVAAQTSKRILFDNPYEVPIVKKKKRKKNKN